MSMLNIVLAVLINTFSVMILGYTWYSQTHGFGTVLTKYTWINFYLFLQENLIDLIFKEIIGAVYKTLKPNVSLTWTTRRLASWHGVLSFQ